MTFIPKELQEDKRSAETALGIIMLSHPEQARLISLYFGKLESVLHTKRIFIFAYGWYYPSGGVSDCEGFIDVENIDDETEISEKLLPFARGMESRDEVNLAVANENGLEMIWRVKVAWCNYPEEPAELKVILSRPHDWNERYPDKP